MIAAGCGGAAHAPATPKESGWPLPAGWKREEIPFPLGFAPTLNHQGVEELRFPPGFSKAESPNHWSYAFEWRLTDEASLDAGALGAELAAYFRGLLVAVDGDRHRFDPAAITATATARGDGFAIAAHVFAAFGDAAPIDLTGHARRYVCAEHRVVWRFVLAPAASPLRKTLDDLVAIRPCME